MELLLKNVTTIDGVVKDVRVPGFKKEAVVDFSGHFLYPGLTNWHDHLEMNLYPKLGTPPYNNYTEWMKDIYKPKESPIKEIEKTDKDYRLLWGGLKNLVSGVTTVYHHNASKRILEKDSFPVFVPLIEWAHSLFVEKTFRYRKDRPFIIHLAEGIDDFAAKETAHLDLLGYLKPNTYIVHGISADWKLVESQGASVIWCPSSNLYMFNKTADVAGRMNVLLGTDSTLTGSPTLLDEMRVAANYVSKEEIVKMVTTNSEGFFISSKELFSTRPKDIKLVVSRGRIRLQDPAIGLPPLKHGATDIDVDKLKLHFEKKVGTKILEQNPLWRLIN
jgi:cytosine/adenosine deaminase-related metal-dependent hydrolase